MFAREYTKQLSKRITDCCSQINESHQKWLIIFAALYKFSLDINYIFAVSSIYYYEGMMLQPSAFKYLLSTVLYFGLFSVMPKKENVFTTWFLNLQFAVIIAPMLCMYALSSRNNTAYILAVCACVLLQILILSKRKPETELVKISIRRGKSYTIVFLSLFIAFCLIVSILYNGFAGLKAFDFNYIYEMRRNAEYPFLFGYFLSWITMAIIPFFIVFSLFKRQYFYCTLLCLVQLMFYMIMGNKAIFLILIVIIGVYIVARLNIIIKGLYLALSSVCSIITIMVSLEKSPFVLLINSFWGERFLFGPAMNKFLYYELFSQYPYIHFADGLIGRLFSLPYIYTNTSGFINYAFYHGGSFASNSVTGYLGESFAQLGFVGVVLMSILLAYIIKFIDNSTAGLNFASLAAIFSVPVVILNDAPLFTTLLTGGMFILILLVFIFNEPYDNKINTLQGSKYHDNFV